ncbi:MAG: S8 family peptidase [Thaumarchaeota archaeon]|nr:S8 family peptidase [Nitrososphaerota archaeon]
MDVEYVRKKRPAIPQKLERNYEEFSEKQFKNLDAIKTEFVRERIFDDYQQELVFKIKTTRSVGDDQFREDLRKVGIDTIWSAPGKNAEWLVSTSDPNFDKLKEKITNRIESDKVSLVDNIATFEHITNKDKEGETLKKYPLGAVEVDKLHISLSKKETDVDGRKLDAAIQKIIKLTETHNLQVHDLLKTENLCLLLVSANKKLAQEIMKLDIVTKVDRTPTFRFEEILFRDFEQIKQVKQPPNNAHGVLVMDSGIIKHPLLLDAIPSDGINGLPDRREKDDRAHGTMVSSIALHGDIQKCIDDKKFEPEVFIHSSKLFYQDGNTAIVNEPKLFEKLLIESLEDMIGKYPRCKVINLSFGIPENILQDKQKQFDLAALIDELSMRHKDIIFVISIGNIESKFSQQHQYPDYLHNGHGEIRITDPSSSAHAISVGALQNNGREKNLPSTLTRIGPGLNGMIKPELVETGGGYNEPVAVFNPDFRQRLFTVNKGTSFSAPKVAHYLAKLMNNYPDTSRNMIKALLMSSAKIPSNLQDGFPKLKSSISTANLSQILNVYGNGKPNFENANVSNDNRVVFVYDGSIQIDHVRYFTINLPEEFISVKGEKEITVTLVFDPIVRQRRADYLGIRMEFHLFRNVSIDEIHMKYDKIPIASDGTEDEESEGKVPEELIKYEIKMMPTNSLRKKSTHQKGVVTMSHRSRVDGRYPLVLAVVCQKRWEMDENIMQNFAVIMTLEHSQQIDLYNKIKTVNRIEAEARTRIRV